MTYWRFIIIIILVVNTVNSANAEHGASEQELNATIIGSGSPQFNIERAGPLSLIHI